MKIATNTFTVFDILVNLMSFSEAKLMTIGAAEHHRQNIKDSNIVIIFVSKY